MYVINTYIQITCAYLITKILAIHLTVITKTTSIRKVSFNTRSLVNLKINDEKETETLKSSHVNIFSSLTNITK